MNNGRDCPHGRQVGKCDTCDLVKAELELQKVTVERDAFSAGNERLRAVIKSALSMLVRQEDALRASGRDEPNAEPIIILCEDVLSESPRQHLQERDVRNAEVGYYNGFKDALVIEKPLPPPTGTYATIDILAYRVEQASRYAASQYAERVMAGEK